MCDILVTHTHTFKRWAHTQTPNHIPKHNDVHSRSQEHTHTHTHPSLQVDLNHNSGCRNGLSVQIKSVFLRIKQRWWWWHFRSPLQTQMPKHHSVIPSFSHTRTLALNQDPGAFLIEAKWFVCFYSSNENRLSGIYTSSADLTTYTFPSCFLCSLAKTDMWKGPELGFQTATQHEYYLGLFGSRRHHGKIKTNRKTVARFSFLKGGREYLSQTGKKCWGKESETRFKSLASTLVQRMLNLASKSTWDHNIGLKKQQTQLSYFIREHSNNKLM